MRQMLRIVVAAFVLVVWPRAAFSAEAHWPSSLTIGTASPGGTYYAYGEWLARILTRELGLPVDMRPTEGPNQNIALLEAGEIQLAFVTLGAALHAWNGTALWTAGKQFRAMRAMFPMCDTPFQFMVLQDSGIQSLADLTGKRVGVGPQGGTGGDYIPLFFKTLGIESGLIHGDWADLAARMQARTLDALAVAAGVPFPSFAEIEAKGKVRYLPLTPKQILDLRLAVPELGPSLVPAGTYPSLLRRYPTVGLFNFAVARSDLADDLVYAIVNAVFANHEKMIEIHPAAAETVAKNFTRNTFLPFHGGAIRWYDSRSVTGIVQGD